jgi:branched-chain amino acid transport system ATP-binding protein
VNSSEDLDLADPVTPVGSVDPADSVGLVVDNIDVSYGRVQALRGVSLTIAPGEMVALLGANGAGKSSTLRAISGMVAPSAGRIMFDGQPVHGLASYEVVGRGIAHLPEGRELFPTLSVEENLRFGYYSRRKEKAAYRAKLDHVMDVFPRLRERRTQAAGTLSGGEQQMLAAARALMSSPRLLLVDELSLGLAPLIVRDLFDALHEVNATGTSVLIVEQFVHLALANTSRAYVLAKGEVVLEGPSAELAEDGELVAAAYLGASVA